MGTPITRLARRLVVRAAVEMWTVCELQYRLSLKKVLCRGWTNHFGALQRKKCLFWTRRSCLNMWRSDSCSRDWSFCCRGVGQKATNDGCREVLAALLCCTERPGWLEFAPASSPATSPRDWHGHKQRHVGSCVCTGRRGWQRRFSLLRRSG